MVNNIIPELRFPQFSGDWTEKKYGDIYSFKTTNSYSRDKLNYENGEVKNIHYGDIHTSFNSLFDITKEYVPFINEDIDISRIPEECYLKEGDLVIADASEDYNDIGKTIEIKNLNNEKVVAGLHTLLARKESDAMANDFASFLMKTERVRFEIMKIAQGTKVLGLSKNRLDKILLITPTPAEQSKIATFLTYIDKRINLLQKKKAEFEFYKNGVLQKLFSKRIRFKDDNGNDFPDWEEKKLWEVCLKQASNISANTLSENEGEYKIYGATGFLKSIDFYQEENPYISIVKDGAGVGRTLVCDAKTSVLGTLDIIKPKGKNNLVFLYYLINQIDFNKYITGSTIPHIYFKDYSKVNVKMPAPKEQQKIANFLSSIDTSIEKMGNQIDESVVFKKGLLQKMFV